MMPSTRDESTTRSSGVSARCPASISATPVAVQARDGSPVSSTRGSTATAVGATVARAASAVTGDAGR